MRVLKKVKWSSVLIFAVAWVLVVGFGDYWTEGINYFANLKSAIGLILSGLTFGFVAELLNKIYETYKTKKTSAKK